MRQYSHFFSTIHDESEPLGDLGRGAHYSVLRAVLWQPKLAFHDFAAIWDEDHDVRVIWVAEQLLAEGLLAPVVAIGERKGALAVITSTRTSEKYAQQVEDIAQGVPHDPFTSDVAFFPESVGTVIQAEEARVRAYLAGIFALWQVGTKKPQFSTEGLAP